MVTPQGLWKKARKQNQVRVGGKDSILIMVSSATGSAVSLMAQNIEWNPFGSQYALISFFVILLFFAGISLVIIYMVLAALMTFFSAIDFVKLWWKEWQLFRKKKKSNEAKRT